MGMFAGHTVQRFRLKACQSGIFPLPASFLSIFCFKQTSQYTKMPLHILILRKQMGGGTGISWVKQFNELILFLQGSLCFFESVLPKKLQLTIEIFSYLLQWHIAYHPSTVLTVPVMQPMTWIVFLLVILRCRVDLLFVLLIKTMISYDILISISQLQGHA